MAANTSTHLAREQKAFEKALRVAGRRLSINAAGRCAATVLIVAGAAAGAVVAAQRTLGLRPVPPAGVWGFAVAALAAIAVMWVRCRPSRMLAAVRIDQRLALRERFSTAVAVTDAEDPFAHAARADALTAADRVNLHGRFPVECPRQWVHVAWLWVLTGILALWMPQLDLLGIFRAREDRQRKVARVEQATSDVQAATVKVTAAVKRLSDSQLAKDLGELSKPSAGLEPAAIRRQAIRKLTAMGDKVKQIRQNADLAAAEDLRRKLRKLRGLRLDGPMSKFSKGLAQGDLTKAADAVGELQKRLASGEFTEAQKKAMAEQLAKIAAKLQALAADKKALADALAEQGLDPAMKNLTAEQLKKALQKKGLNSQQIKRLCKLAKGVNKACKQCSGLGKCCGLVALAPGGMSAGGLGPLADQLSELEIAELRLAEAEASLAEIDNAILALGVSGCKGGGRPCPKPGMGMGPGIGMGPRPESSDKVGFQRARVKNPPDDGSTPPIATWTVQAEQIRGESRQQLREMVSAAKSEFADAISQRKVPKKYEGPVGEYFERMEGAGEE